MFQHRRWIAGVEGGPGIAVQTVSTWAERQGSNFSVMTSQMAGMGKSDSRLAVGAENRTCFWRCDSGTGGELFPGYDPADVHGDQARATIPSRRGGRPPAERASIEQAAAKTGAHGRGLSWHGGAAGQASGRRTTSTPAHTAPSPRVPMDVIIAPKALMGDGTLLSLLRVKN